LKLLITGASGFIGSHLIHELSEFSLDAISSSKDKIVSIDNCFSWNKLDEITGTYDAIIHLAGLAHDTSNQRSEKDYFDVNVGLTEKLLDIGDRLHIKTFICLSSVKAVVDSVANYTLTEDDKSTATHVYGRSKREAESVILNHISSYTKLIYRPVLVYGPNQKGNLGTLESLLHKGIPLPLKSWRNRRSVLYVKNLCSAIHLSLKSKIESGVYFVADDQPVSTAQLLHHIGKGIGSEPRLFSIPEFIIKMLISFPIQSIQHQTNKVYGSLEVSNRKLLSALNIERMPYSTEQGFNETYSAKTTD